MEFLFGTAKAVPFQNWLSLFLAFGGAALLCRGLFLGRLLRRGFLRCTLFRSGCFGLRSSLLFTACSFWFWRRRRSFLLRQFRRGKPLAVKSDLSDTHCRVGLAVSVHLFVLLLAFEVED